MSVRPYPEVILALDANDIIEVRAVSATGGARRQSLGPRLSTSCSTSRLTNGG